MPLLESDGAIKAIDKTSVHRITSGQVVIDLQTAVKELVENSLDAGATNIEVRFKQHGLKSIEVIDNGSGIPEAYHDSIALKHYTSKLSSFSDLATVRTFGFRGEALSSLCALSESLSVNTTTEPPMGVSLEMASSGKVTKRSKIARQRGTTVTVTNLFKPLPVRRKEFERNAKREFSKALGLLNAYALVSTEIRLTVSNVADKGQKTVQLRTSGASTSRALASELWGPKALDNIVDLDLTFEVERDKTSLKRIQGNEGNVDPIATTVKGLISKFSIGGGRTGTDRQFFYVNGRPCNLSKIQKAFNEVYRSFNATQAPFILANFIIPTNSCDINVSPDKRTIFLHNEGNLVARLKAALEEAFAPSRSTFDVERQRTTQTVLSSRPLTQKRSRSAIEGHDHLDVAVDEDESGPRKKRLAGRPPSASSRISNDEEHEETPSPIRAGLERRTESGSTAASSVPMQASKAKGKSRPRNCSEEYQDEVDSDEEPDNKDIEVSLALTPSPTSPTVAAVRKDNSRSSSHPSFPDRSPQPQITDPRPSTQNHDRDETRHAEGRPENVEHMTSPEAPFSTSIMPMAAEARNSSPLPPLLRHPSQKRPSIQAQHSRDSVLDDDDDDGIRDEKEEERSLQLQRVDVEDEMMVVDVEREPLNAASVVLDTTRAAWSLTTFTQKAVVETQSKLQSPPSSSSDSRADANRLKPTTTTSAAHREANMSNHLTNVPRTPPVAEQEERVIEAEAGEVEPLFLDDDTCPQDPSPRVNSSRPAEPDPHHSPSTAIDLTVDDFDDSHITSMLDETTSVLQYEETIFRPEVIRTSDTDSGEITLRFDLSRILDAWLRLRSGAASMNDVGPTSLRLVPSDAGVANMENNESAATALARIIDKKDFSTMDIIGQFNLGFIVARRRNIINGTEEGADAVMDDLFIVDQHAADEKYNFEILQQTTTINSQKLFKPQRMELTASDELIALENTDVLRQNGFEIEEVEEEGEAVRQGAKLRLVAQPVSKSTVFDMKDLEELIHLMRDRPSGQMVRCSKARAMFAMRACRKSVMVGMPLNKQQMTAVVNHMGTMDQPWNCPHGRPTMRHLLDLSELFPKSASRNQARRIDWTRPLS